MPGEPDWSAADDLWERLPVALYRTAPDGRILDANQQFVALLGYPDRDSLLQARAETLYADPADRGRWKRLLESAGVVRGFETRLRRADGSTLWVRDTARVVRDAEGDVRCYEGTVEDVTERERSDELLRASEARYRLLFDRNLAGVYRSTLDGKILECNDAFARTYGYASRRELEGRDAHELYPSPSVREAFIARLRETGQLVNGELAGRRKDGSPIWTLENVSLVDAEPPGLIEGTLVDVTERKRAEAAWRRSEAQWSQFLEASPDPVWLKDDGGRYVAANDALLRLRGWQRDALIGKTDRDVWPDRASLHAEREAIALRTGVFSADVSETLRGRTCDVHAHHRSGLLAGAPPAGNARRGARHHGAKACGGGAARERGTLPVAAGEHSALRPRDRSRGTGDLDERRRSPDDRTHRRGPGPRAGISRPGLRRGPAPRGPPPGACPRRALVAIRVRRCRRRRAARLRVVLRSGPRKGRRDPQAHRDHRGHHGAQAGGSGAAPERAAAGDGVVGRGARLVGPGSPHRPGGPERAMGADVRARARGDRRVDAGLARPCPPG